MKAFLRIQKHSQLLILMAGILPGLVLAAGYLTLDRMAVACARGCGIRIFHDLALFQLLYVVIFLLQRRSIGDAHGRQREKNFLDLLRAKDGEISGLGEFYLAAVRRYDPATGDTEVDSPQAETLCRLMLRPERVSDATSTRSIHADLLTVAGRDDLSVAEEMLVLDILISDALTYEGLYSPEQLDIWSRRLAELGPSNQAARATRAAVLVTLGQFEEGKRALDALGPGDEVHDELFYRLFRAEAECGLGNIAAARQILLGLRETIASWPKTAAMHVRLDRLAERITQAER